MSMEIKIGDFVEVTESEYTRAAPPGTRGTVTRIDPKDAQAKYSIDRADGTGIGWAAKVKRVKR